MDELRRALGAAPDRKLSRKGCLALVVEGGISKNIAVEALRRLEEQGKIVKVERGREVDIQLTDTGAVPY
ncbi:MAG: hypothetical protein KGJ98_14210 [Chloroflexota bacterium]|nr:hypothetical protein [Chloroflexota bacterium]